MVSVYKLLDKSEYDSTKTYNGHTDYYQSPEFNNLGSIRWNLTQTQVLLEQVESKFPPGLNPVWTKTNAEVLEFIQTNKSSWEEDIEY